MKKTSVRKSSISRGLGRLALLLTPVFSTLMMGAKSIAKQDHTVANMLYAIFATLVAAFLIGVVVVVWNSRRASERKLKNIRYILDVEENLFQAPTDPAQFNAALKKAEDFMKVKRAFFWVEDEFSLQPQQQRLWGNGEVEVLMHGTQFQVVYPSLLERLGTHGAIICHKSDLYSAPPEVRALCRELQAESVMMIVVKKRDGTPKGILGALDLPGTLRNAELLEQIALSFSMAMEQHDAYKRINQIGHTDSMTGLTNWNGFHEDLVALKRRSLRSLACVYVDANGLHEINNRLGHAAGDEMLIQIAKAMSTSFPDDMVYRVGGDEFAVLCVDGDRESVDRRLGLVNEIMRRTEYETLSIGVARSDSDIDPMAVVKEAEKNMRANKEKYYASAGRERQIRSLDDKTAQVFSRQRDMETFLTILAPQFKGVYFVNLRQDTIRHLFIPSYFEKLLEEQDDMFSKGLMAYADRMVKPEYTAIFERLCDYNELKARLDEEKALEFTYQKKNGNWQQLRITKAESDQQTGQETLWIFTDTAAFDEKE